MPLKHPEFVTKLAADLKRQNLSFHIHLIGDGELKEQLQQ